MLMPFVAWSIWFMSTMPIHVVMCKKQNDMDRSVWYWIPNGSAFFWLDGYATLF
jgi:hypothetical protein